MAAVAGVNDHDTNQYEMLPNLLTPLMITLWADTSNVGMAGLWMFSGLCA